MMRSRRLLALLLLVVALSACRGRADEVREEALASVEIALEITHERPEMVGGDAEVQAAWTETLLALDGAAGALSACGGKVDDCLATSLKQLLDADRQLLLVEQLGGVGRACDFGDLQNQARQAAKLPYVYFYGEEVPENEEWRGPPTPRPLGVCPGG